MSLSFHRSEKDDASCFTQTDSCRGLGQSASLTSRPAYTTKAKIALDIVGNALRLLRKTTRSGTFSERVDLSAHVRIGVRRIALSVLLLFSTAHTQVQINGTISLTGSVQLMGGAKHCAALTWLGTQGQEISFRVYRSTTSGSHYQLVQSLIPCLHYTDLNVSDGTTYYYVVTAYNSSTNAESAYSNQVTVTIAN